MYTLDEMKDFQAEYGLELFDIPAPVIKVLIVMQRRLVALEQKQNTPDP